MIKIIIVIIIIILVFILLNTFKEQITNNTEKLDVSYSWTHQNINI